MPFRVASKRASGTIPGGAHGMVVCVFIVDYSLVVVYMYMAIAHPPSIVLLMEHTTTKKTHICRILKTKFTYVALSHREAV